MKVESLEAVVRALNQSDVHFILVGGLAVNAHGYGRFTADVDLVVQLDTANIERAFAALGALGYTPRVPIAARDFADASQRDVWIREKGMQVLNFHSDMHRETPVDIFVSEPFDFDTEFSEAIVEQLSEGAPVRIVKLGRLLAMKQQAGRPQDLADIAERRALHENNP